MKLIWFSHFVPFPPHGGNLQRSFNLIRQISSGYETHLFALNAQGKSRETIEESKTQLNHYCQSIEICDLPFRWRGAQWWAEAAASPLFGPPFSCRALFSKANLAQWTQFLSAHPNALVHFDSIDLALYVDAARNYHKVLNHHNCESAMTMRMVNQQKNPIQRKYMRLQAGKIAAAERALCSIFDVNIVVSEQDRKLLEAIQPGGRYCVVENGVDTSFFAPPESKPEPHTAIFAGMLGWGPNISAMNLLVREIWPEVVQVFPDARLYLAGKNPPRHVMEWPKQNPSITVVPNPEDMRPWLARAEVCVCPIIEGGGTRLKILDAFAMGKPVVSTTVGCEGLRVEHGENILVADTPETFAAAVIRLFEDNALRDLMGRGGRSLVEREYRWERIGRQLQHAYQSIVPQGNCVIDQPQKPRRDFSATPR